MPVDNLINLRWFLLGGFPSGVLGGLALNVLIALIAFVASFLLGHLLALGRLSRPRILRWPCTAYIELVRSVPLLIVLFWFYFSIPILLGTAPSPIVAALVALSAYGAAYQAEYIRAGIAAVGRGEREAARSLGLSRMATLFHVVLAQAHRKMLPTYASYFTSLFKDSSALYILGLVELMQAGLIVAERAPSKMLQVYLTVGTLFFVVCFTASRAAKYLERRLAPPPLGSPEPASSAPDSFAPLSLSQLSPLKEDHHAHA
jgi:polar amino acid transport system permease protein